MSCWSPPSRLSSWAGCSFLCLLTIARSHRVFTLCFDGAQLSASYTVWSQLRGKITSWGCCRTCRGLQAWAGSRQKPRRRLWPAGCCWWSGVADWLNPRGPWVRVQSIDYLDTQMVWGLLKDSGFSVSVSSIQLNISFCQIVKSAEM